MVDVKLIQENNENAFNNPQPGDLWHEMFIEQLRVIKVNDDDSLFIRHSLTGEHQLLKVSRAQFGHMLKYHCGSAFCCDVIRGKSVYDLPEMIENGLFVEFENSGLSPLAVEIFSGVYVVANEKGLIDLCLEIGVKKPDIPVNVTYPAIFHRGRVERADELLKETCLVRINRIFDSISYNKRIKTLYGYDNCQTFRDF